MNVPEWVAVGFIGVIVTVIGWGIKRLLMGQDTMVTNQSQMTVQLTTTCERLAAVRDWQTSHDEKDDERHKENSAEHDKFWVAIEKMRT